MNLGLWHNALNWFVCNLDLNELGFTLNVDCIGIEMNLSLWHDTLN